MSTACPGGILRMWKIVRPIGLALAAAVAITVLACSGKQTTPTNPTPTPVAVTIAAPAIKAPSSGVQLDTLRPTLEVTNAVTTGTVGTVTYHFEASEQDTFPAGSRTFVADGVSQGSGSTSVIVGPSDLIPHLIY